MSYYLLQVLERAPAGITYADLVWYVADNLSQNGFEQIPQLMAEEAMQNEPFLARRKEEDAANG
jgi:hypothetical protein